MTPRSVLWLSVLFFASLFGLTVQTVWSGSRALGAGQEKLLSALDR